MTGILAEKRAENLFAGDPMRKIPSHQKLPADVVTKQEKSRRWRLFSNLAQSQKANECVQDAL